jgi:class 3 adenylate cyclase
VAEERVQRRLAAILAADVVGYSRLMEADEEGTLARMKALRDDVIDPRIAEYGGRIFKTTGDGILAEFPSAVDAVRHAVDVQRAMAGLNANAPEDGRMVFRIGISLGDVMVDGDDLFGNGVNVPRAWKGLPNRAPYACPAIFRSTSGIRSMYPSRIWANRPSRISTGRYGAIAFI